ncbi:MAG: hypothetical protein SFY56_10200 [Bacteroidota bacterium]|nr:hypothetical protein [Bacteroidota bacterium]
MLNELITNKEKYHWSRSINNNIIVGGYDSGRFYGQAEFIFSDTFITVKTQISNGVSSSKNIPDTIIAKGTADFDLIQNFSQSLDEYLELPDIQLDYLIKRRELLDNTFNLLPKYE